MKKLFLFAFGIFAFSLILSTETENSSLTNSSALANDCGCVNEQGSLCACLGTIYHNMNRNKVEED